MEPPFLDIAGLIMGLLLNGIKRLLFSARQSTTSAMTFSISWITMASPVLELCVMAGRLFDKASSSSKRVASDAGGMLSGAFDVVGTNVEADSEAMTGSC